MTSLREDPASITNFGLAAVVASLAWIGWFALSPHLGFPDVSPARLLATILTPASEDAESGSVAWILVVGGLALAAAAYLVITRLSHIGGPGSAVVYAIALWFVVGAIVMPLLAAVVDRPTSGMGAPLSMGMRPTFMMLSEGGLAPLSGLIGWLAFGAGLSLGVPRARERETPPLARLPRTVVALALAIVLLVALAGFAVGGTRGGYEVWVIDQEGTGALYIYEGSALTRGADDAEPEVIDLGAAATGVGDGPGDSPHMLTFNRERTYALIANRYSGHVYFMRVEDREIVASIDVGEEAHDMRASPDGEIALVSKQADMKIGVIETDYENEEFSYDADDDLDLGALQGPDFPDNRPRCALFPREDRTAYVTPSGGGVFIVDANESPPRIVKSFTSGEVTQSGCGAVTHGGKLYLGWGSSDLSRLYAFDYEDHSLMHAVPVNKHGPDGHGMTLVGDGRYLWMAIRGSHRIVVVDVLRGGIVGTISGFGILPDMPVVSPDGDYVFLTLRGGAFFVDDPESPLIERTTPGIVVFEVLEEGKSGVPVAFVPLPDRAGAQADPHAVAIVPTGS